MSKSSSATGGKPVNRSAAVRDALAQNPKAGSKEIITLLAAKGIKVSPTLVYYVKSKQNQSRRRARRAELAAESRRTATTDPVELVMRVKQLAGDVGGIRNLKLLVDLLATT